MTGAMVPQGADQVIQFEVTEEKNGLVRFLKKVHKSNISYKGENFKAGDKILDRGSLISIQALSVLSILGLKTVRVNKMPVVSVITTGSES